MSGRFASSSKAAISASSRCSAASSAAGAISTSSTSPSERCVNVENQRSDSISTSNMSTRTARSSVAGKTSRRPPRSANCPRSSTCSTRSYPAATSSAAHSSRSSSSPTRSVNECGRSAGSGTFSESATARHTTTDWAAPDGRRRLSTAPRAPQQSVERRHAQTHEVRRRRQVRLVGDPPRGVVAHPPRREPRAQVGGQIARRAIVAHDHQRRPRPLHRPDLRERRDQDTGAATPTRTRGRPRAPVAAPTRPAAISPSSERSAI